MTYGERLKKGADDRPGTILDKLALILEHSHNAYTFRYRCKGQHFVIERTPDGRIEGYYDDGREGRVEIDVTQEPFNKLVRYS
jgi:hypothetical protein